MRFLILFLLCLLCSHVATAQSKPVWQLKGELGFTEQSERISCHKYLKRENKLLLISHNNLQLLDVGNAKVVDFRPVNLPRSVVCDEFDDWMISPDGRKVLVVGDPDAKQGAQQETWIWDAETGKRIAVLDKGPTPIRVGLWSENGQTLVTFDHNLKIEGPYKVGISFWDGETFEYRHSISVDYPRWTYLSDDGKRFFAASGRKKNFLGVKYVSDSRGVINVWDTSSGQIEKTIAVSDEDFNIKTSKISVSPDEKFLIFVNKHKSKAAEHRLLAWEMNGSIYPKYEFKAHPKIDDSRVRFSPDGKYFALDVGKNLQIYETQTGEKRFELRDVEPPDFWLNDNKTLINDGFKKMQAFEIVNGMKLYEQKLVYETASAYTGTMTTDEYGNTNYQEETVTVDITRIVPHPNGKMFLTYSNQYVKVFDSRTGEIIQTIISPDLAAPEIDFCKKKPKECKGTLVRRAAWSSDGRTLYVLNGNRRTVSLWEMLGN